MVRAWIRVAALLCAMAAVAGGMSPGDRIDFADGLRSRGLYDLAIREYRAFLDAHPEHADAPRVLMRLADTFRDRGEIRAAEAFYQRVIRDFPGHALRPKAEFLRAELYVQVEQYADALHLFEALIERDLPANLRAAAGYYRGTILVRLDRVEDAETALRSIIDEYPEAPHADPARLELAALLAEAGRTEEAIALYRAAGRSSRATIAAEALYQRARLAFDDGDMAGAASLFERLLRDHADDARAGESARIAAWAFQNDGRHAAVLELAESVESADVAQEAEWAYLAANSRRRLLDIEGALRDYDVVLERDPDGPFAESAAYEGALLALDRNAYADAIRRAGAVALDGAMAPDLHWVLALAHAGAGDEPRSIQFLQRLLDRFPEHARAGDAGYRLGRLLMERAQWAEAVSLLREFAERHPDHPAFAPGLLAAAHAAEQQEDPARALVFYDRLVERRPDDRWMIEALLRRARLLARMGRDEEAKAAYADVLEQTAEGSAAAESGYWLGVLRERAGDAAGAESALRAARAQAEDDGWRHRIDYALAGVAQRQGRDEEAAQQLEALLHTAMRREIPPELLEWLAGFRFAENNPAAAADAAAAWLEHPDADARSRARAGLLRGRALAAAGETETAVELLEASLQAHPAGREGVKAWLALADLLYGQEQWKEAQSAFEAAAGHASDSADADLRAHALFGLGRTAERLDQWDQGARFFMGVAILFDDESLSPEALYRAAHCYQQLDQEEAANAALRELSERYPDSPWAASESP